METAIATELARAGPPSKHLSIRPSSVLGVDVPLLHVLLGERPSPVGPERRAADGCGGFDAEEIMADPPLRPLEIPIYPCSARRSAPWSQSPHGSAPAGSRSSDPFRPLDQADGVARQNTPRCPVPQSHAAMRSGTYRHARPLPTRRVFVDQREGRACDVAAGAQRPADARSRTGSSPFPSPRPAPQHHPAATARRTSRAEVDGLPRRPCDVVVIPSAPSLRPREGSSPPSTPRRAGSCRDTGSGTCGSPSDRRSSSLLWR